MKLLSYIQQHSKDVKLPDGSVEVETYLQSEGLYANDSNFDVQMAEAKRLAFDGKVTVKEIPDEPHKPTTEQRVSELEEALIQADETAITLYEAQEEQEAINAQQDEALMEIYEMIG